MFNITRFIRVILFSLHSPFMFIAVKYSTVWIICHKLFIHFTLFKFFQFINPLGKALCYHCRISPSCCKHWQSLFSAPDFIISFLVSKFTVFLGSFSSQTGHVLQIKVGFIFFFFCLIQEIVNYAEASYPAIHQMGSESKYKNDIWCSLVHF